MQTADDLYQTIYKHIRASSPDLRALNREVGLFARWISQQGSHDPIRRLYGRTRNVLAELGDGYRSGESAGHEIRAALDAYERSVSGWLAMSPAQASAAVELSANSLTDTLRSSITATTESSTRSVASAPGESNQISPLRWAEFLVTLVQGQEAAATVRPAEPRELPIAAVLKRTFPPESPAVPPRIADAAGPEGLHHQIGMMQPSLAALAYQTAPLLLPA